MSSKRVLFVDDEPNILDGLRRMLRSMRKEFEMSFATGGVQALQIMEEKDFDIIVSDMRMPGMDGAQLLAEVKKKHPHTIRIMLTGQADEESVMRTIGVVHQFLAKPCDPEMLKEILQKSSALHRLMVDGKLKDIITEIDSLPSIPSLYEKLQSKLKDPEVVIEDIAKIIGQDLAMTAKMLQLVNSAFFGLYQKVETPERAVTLLGLDTVKALVLGVQIFSEMKHGKNAALIDMLWKHSMSVGVMAKKIIQAETDDTSLSGDTFLAGILHDLGKLLLLSKMRERYREVMDTARLEHITLYDSEEKILQSSHCQVGGYLTGLWGFPTSIVEAVSFHHSPEIYPVQSFTPALAIHIADAWYYTYNPDEAIGCPPRINEEIVAAIGLEHRLDFWKEICREHLEFQDVSKK
jgi:HD-like signal output (HDOD) protein